MSLSSHLKQYREDHSLSLRDLAEKMKVSPSTLCKLERGTQEAKVSTLRRIASTLRVGIDELLACPPSEHQENEPAEK